MSDFIDPAFEQLVRERRSVRLFEKTPVPEAVMEKCLDLALLAPNSSNLQPWEFHWVRTEPKRAELVKACESQAAAATAAELVVCVARTNTWREACADMVAQLERHEKQGDRIPKAAWAYYRKLVALRYRQGPLGLFGLAKRIYTFFRGLRHPIQREPNSRQDMRIWAIKSTVLACENLMLAARAQGYDTCPMEGFDHVRVRKILNLPRDAEIPTDRFQP
jgi:nitroreductase